MLASDPIHLWRGSARSGVAMAGDSADEQIDAIVADDLAMLAEDIFGLPYSKVEHNRRLQSSIERPRGSIE